MPPDQIPGLSANMDPTDPAIPAVVAAPVEPAPEPKGLDKWGKLFDNEDKKPDPNAAPQEPAAPFNPSALLADEEAVSALLSKTDFSKSISDDTQKLISDNDPGALLALTNDIGKQAYIQAMRHSAAMTEKYVAEQIAKQSTDVTSKINSHIADRELATLLPEINNPLVAAGIDTFVERYRAQNPTASTADVVTQVKEYMGDLNDTINKPKVDPNKPDEGVDWLEGLL